MLLQITKRGNSIWKFEPKTLLGGKSTLRINDIAASLANTHE